MEFSRSKQKQFGWILGLCMGIWLATSFPPAWARVDVTEQVERQPKGRTHVSIFTLIDNYFSAGLKALEGRGPYDLNNHCHFDKLNSSIERDGRRLWARRCGYITNKEFDQMIEEHKYPSFFNKTAPTWEWADCGSYSRGVLMFCFNRCFSSDTRLWFDQKPFHLDDWSAETENPPKTMTTLSEQATAEHPLTNEQPVKLVDLSEFEGTLVEIVLNGNKRVKVTPDHFMVDSLGNLVEAKNLLPGDKLLTVDGAKAIVSLRSVDFSGYVWNIESQAKTVKGNIVVADGIFTESIGIWDALENLDSRLALRYQLAEQLKNHHTETATKNYSTKHAY